MWPWTQLKTILANQALILDGQKTITEAVDELTNTVAENKGIDQLTAQKVDAIFKKMGLEVSDLNIVVTPKQ